MSKIWNNILFTSDKGVFRILKGGVRELLNMKNCYGLTWDGKKNIYVATYREMLRIDTQSNIYMKKQVGIDLHQNLYLPRGVLLTCMAKTGCLGELTPAPYNDMHLKQLYFDNSDKHFNSIFYKDNHFYVCLHARCKTELCVDKGQYHSFLMKLTPQLQAIETWDQVGCGNHNVYVENDKIYTLNSVFSKILEIDTKTNTRREVSVDPIDGHKLFLRGLARSDDYFYIGAAQQAERTKRDSIKGYILAYDSDLNLVDTFKLPRLHHIREIRLTNQIDYAHNGEILDL